MLNQNKSGKILCLDLGTKVTGLAVSDKSQKMAFPRDEIRHCSDEELLKAIQLFCNEEQISSLLIGLPMGWDGEESRQTQWVKEMTEQLMELTGLPATFIDESLSTQEATEKSISKSSRKDSEVALHLLLQHLDSR